MQWRFWQKTGSQELPVIVKSTLMAQFSLASQSVDTLRFLGQPGRFANKGKSNSSEFSIRRSSQAAQRLKRDITTSSSSRAATARPSSSKDTLKEMVRSSYLTGALR